MFDEDKNIAFHESVLSTGLPVLENFAVNLTHERSYILNSLQRLKSSTVCEIKKILLDEFISEYILHIPYSSSTKLLANEDAQNPSCYAKDSYERVMKEQEYLNRIITTLNI